MNDLFDGSSPFGCCGGCGSGEVRGGDLQAVKEEAGTARVEIVGGDAPEDIADGELDGGAVFGPGEGEGGAAAAADLGAADGTAGGVVVVAELLVTEGGAAAATAVGVNVAALEALWPCGRLDDVGHWLWGPHSPLLSVQSLDVKGT